MRTFLVAFFTITFLVAQFCEAQQLSLPLGGYYRAGRYVPVQITGASGPVTVEADGAIPTTIDDAGGTRTTTPMLCAGRFIGPPRIHGGPTVQIPWRSLEDREFLVGVVGVSPSDSIARTIFPGAKTVVVRLDEISPLPGPALAWQSLDAIVVGGPWPGGIRLETLPQLLAGGMVIAVVGDVPPDSRLPWLPMDGGWVLRPNVAGPLGCNGDADAYAPSAGWHPDLPKTDRFRLVIAGIAVTLLMLGSALLPTRWRYPAFGATASVCILLIPQNRTLFRAEGDVLATRSKWEQRDHWIYFADRGNRRIDVPLDAETWPVFASDAQTKELHCALHFTSSGGLLSFTLPPENRLAVVQRSIRPAKSDEGVGPADSSSPMSRLAKALYASAGSPHSTVQDDPTAKVGYDEPTPIWPTVRCR